ncbi:MAG: hypothetical protein IT458_03320 [Planctomycetes bacterium]|nr:hypothetical protein [Planctomycetota bacterium]
MRSYLLLAAPLLLAAACGDNIGRAFDPGFGGRGGTDTTNVQTMVAGGDAPDGRPTVRSVYPKGAGWPTTVPIVVVFSKTMNSDSLAPTSGSAGKQALIFPRLKGTTQALSASYEFVLGGTALVMRGLAPWPNTQGASIEVVIDPEARDVDGLRYGGSEPQVIAEFTPDEDSEVDDGRIVTTLPENAKTNQQRETLVYVVFTKPATTASVTSSNFLVGPSGGTAVAGTRSFPFSSGQQTDGRVLRFVPSQPLPGDAEIAIQVDDTIRFGDGKLDFRNRTPFATFRTLPLREVESVTVGNPVSGYPDKVNRVNLENLRVDVTVPDTTVAGDSVTVRLYGLDGTTKPTTDVNFVRRTVAVPANGRQTVSVDFTGALGTLAKPRFSDGAITLAAQVARGARRTGYVLGSAANDPRLDVNAPALLSVGPPVLAATNDLITDQEHIVFHGRASERVSTATVTANALTATIFAAQNDGRFACRPLLLGRQTAPVDYQLVLTDAAGNPAPPVAGRLVQRGAVTGSVAGGTLVVEAYDDATLQAMVDVEVLIEPGMPQKPAAGRQSARTGGDGRAVFTGLTQASYSVTLIRDGYHLVTLLDSPAGFVSLPLRPRTGATATFTGAMVFVPSAGATALIGSNLLDDPREEEIATASATPTLIPSTAIRPNRLQATTGFVGIYEPTQLSTYQSFAVQMTGSTGTALTPPPNTTAPGAALNLTLSALNAAGTTRNLALPYGLDFAAAAGLDTANLVGRPTGRIVASLQGFPGMTLFGVGFTTLGTGAVYTVNGTYSLSTVLALGAYAPVLWVSAEARDTAGNLSRHRRLIGDASVGTTVDTGAPLGVPTITAPAGAFTGSPSFEFQDRLDASSLIGGFAFHSFTATDPLGRSWTLVRNDVDGAVGNATVQIPDLAGVSVPGLAAGSWAVTAESHLLFSATFSPGSYNLEEIRRQQVKYARAAPRNFTVN